MPANIRISTGLPDADPIIGEAGLFDVLAERLRRRPMSFLYLVPTRALTRRFTHRMLERGIDAFVADQAYTLNDFASRSFTRLRPECRRVDDLQRVLIISRLVSVLRLPALGENAAEFPGLIAALTDAIKRLKQALISPEEYARRLSETGVSGKARALAQIYTHYERELLRLKAIDEQGLFTALAAVPSEQIAHGPAGAGRELIVFHGFYDFTPAQSRFVTTLCQCAKDVLFVLDYEDGRDKLFRPVRQVIAGFDDAAAKPEAQIRRSIAIPPPLENVVRQIFTTPSAACVRTPPEDRLGLIEARDRREEVETIAADIKRSHLKENIPLRQICVTFPKPSAYDSLVREIFPRMGLQFNLARGFPLDRSIVVSAILKMMAVAQSDYQRERVTELFYSPCVSFRFASPDGTTSTVSPATLDRVAREAGVIRGETDWAEKLRQHLEALNKEAADIKKGVVDPETDGDAARRLESLEQQIASTKEVAGAIPEALHALSALRQKQNLPAFCDTLRRLVRRFNIPAGITSREPSSLPPIELEKAFRALGKFERVLEAVERASDEVESEQYELSDFVTLLQNAVRPEEYQVQTYSDAGVQVTGLLDIRGMSFSRVYVGGMLNGDFPSPPDRSIFFSEAEAESLGLPGRARHDAEQRFHFLSLLCSARERIIFSYPMTESGNPTVRSPFVDDLFAFFPDDSIRRISAGEEAFSTDRLYRQLGDGLSMPSGGATCAAVIAWADPPITPVVSRIRHSLIVQYERTRSAQPSAYSGMLCDARVLTALAQTFGERRAFSVTQLETYASCPFRFFCRHVLELEELVLPEEEVTPLSRGGVIHDVLRCFYTERRRCGKSRPTEADLAPARAELVRLAQEKFGALPFDDLFRQKDVDRVVRPQGLIDAFLENETAVETRCEPRLFEFAFGSSSRMQEVDPDSAKPPLKLDRDVWVIGKIDRVDVSPDGGALVLDYKTGGADFPSIRLMLEGRSYQLPLYLLAVQQLLGLVPVAGAYYQVKDGSHCRMVVQLADAEAVEQCGIDVGKKRTAIPNKTYEETLSQVIDAVKQHALRVVRQIREGQFPLTDLDTHEAGCRHCDFKYICRAPEIPDDESGDAS